MFKDIKVNGRLEMKTPYTRKIDLVTRKWLRKCWWEGAHQLQQSCFIVSSFQLMTLNKHFLGGNPIFLTFFLVMVWVLCRVVFVCALVTCIICVCVLLCIHVLHKLMVLHLWFVYVFFKLIIACFKFKCMCFSVLCFSLVSFWCLWMFWVLFERYALLEREWLT